MSATFNVQLLTGQVLLFRPRTLLGHAISILQWQWPSWRPLSHAAPVWVITEPTRLAGIQRTIEPGTYCVDAVGGGLRVNSVAAHLLAGASIIVRDVPPSVRDGIEPAIIAERARLWHHENVGYVSYAKFRLLAFLVRCPLGWRPRDEKGSRVLRSTVCSSYTSRSTYEVFNHDDVPGYRRRWTTPSDLAATRELVTKTRELRRVA